MATLPLPPCDVALVGAGSVGTAVASLVLSSGSRIVGVASRSFASAERAADLLASTPFEIGSLPSADVYLIGTGLDAVEDVARSLAARHAAVGRVVIHFAGAAGVAPLAPVRDAGAHACALHPVQACPDVDSGIRNLPGSAWGVTTSPGAEAWADDFVTMIQGHPIVVPEADRAAWHAAAVVTSNGVAALMAGGEGMLRGMGIPDPERVLGPLAAGTITNARLGGGAAATLTGPVVRGEADVVRMHAAALRDAPELLDLYRSVSGLIARVALTSGRIDEAGYRAVMDVLDDPS